MEPKSGARSVLAMPWETFHAAEAARAALGVSQRQSGTRARQAARGGRGRTRTRTSKRWTASDGSGREPRTSQSSPDSSRPRHRAHCVARLHRHHRASAVCLWVRCTVCSIAGPWKQAARRQHHHHRALRCSPASIASLPLPCLLPSPSSPRRPSQSPLKGRPRRGYYTYWRAHPESGSRPSPAHRASVQLASRAVTRFARFARRRSFGAAIHSQRPSPPCPGRRVSRSRRSPQRIRARRHPHPRCPHTRAHTPLKYPAAPQAAAPTTHTPSVKKTFPTAPAPVDSNNICSSAIT